MRNKFSLIILEFAIGISAAPRNSFAWLRFAHKSVLGVLHRIRLRFFCSQALPDKGFTRLATKPIAKSGIISFFLLFFFFFSPLVFAQQSIPLPEISLKIGQSQTPQQSVLSLQILMLLTVLTLAPAIIIMLTSFTRIIIVFAFTRQALGTQQIPPNQVMVALALFLTFFVMQPVINQINNQALQPYLKGEINQPDAINKAFVPLRGFMFKQTRQNDLALMAHLSKIPRPTNREDIPTYVLIPAFIISELKTAFQMGFVIFVPFLIIDMVVASALMSMGMMLLPPVIISFPFKILLFIMVDGWHLITRSLVYSFH